MPDAMTQVVTSPRDTNVRLPGHLHPEEYKIYLMPFIIPHNFTIAGYVSILVNVTEASRNVTLHTYQTTIHEGSVVVLDGAGDSPIPVEGHGYDEDRQFYIVKLSRAPTEGQISVNVYFTGELNRDLAGFYRSTYTDSQTGEERYIATTQFEATDARRAFPCFDEPAMKARFQINLARTSSFSSISNMPIDIEGVQIPGRISWPGRGGGGGPSVFACLSVAYYLYLTFIFHCRHFWLYFLKTFRERE